MIRNVYELFNLGFDSGREPEQSCIKGTTCLHVFLRVYKARHINVLYFCVSSFFLLAEQSLCGWSILLSLTSVFNLLSFENEASPMCAILASPLLILRCSETLRRFGIVGNLASLGKHQKERMEI